MTVSGALEQAIEAGLRFLIASQSEAGYWSDWDLPVGESRIWTTVYVGYRLATSPHPALHLVEHALCSAAAWIARSEFPGGGWGYIEEVGADADSTALAILFLSSRSLSVPPRSYERLRSFQRDNGGFSTYTCEESFGAWTASHPDVTALAIPALLARYEPDEPFLIRAIDYEYAQATPEGLWNSYWWNTPLYATEANLRWMKDLQSAFRAHDALSRVQPNNAFETALLVLCLLYTGCPGENSRAANLLAVLVDAQLSDGSWPSEPILRLPPRDCFQPWTSPQSVPLFADQHRIFTSATVVAALSSACMEQRSH